MRAALDSIPCQSQNVRKVLEKVPSIEVKKLNADGGITLTLFIMQLLADLLNKDLTKIEMPNVASLGADLLTGLKVNIDRHIDKITECNMEQRFFHTLNSNRDIIFFGTTKKKPLIVRPIKNTISLVIKNRKQGYHLTNTVIIFFIGILAAVLLFQNNCFAQQKQKPRIIVCSDIGGTDPDDFQSTIHLLMYANQFEIEGLVSSPFGNGRKEDFLRMIDLYEKDLPQLASHAEGYPSGNALRKVCKQGVIPEAPYKGFRTPTDGSKHIIKCAKKKSNQPLWILVWGGIEDLAQALHDAPEIKKNIKVYWIGGPNKKWSINAYAYIAENHPDLWMIEANATYRGWFMDAESPENLTGKNYYANYIRGWGAMGKDFINYYKGEIKMGDTPSLAYLMNGNADEPTGESWGGSFTPIRRSSRTIFFGNSSLTDTVPVYSVLEWRFKGPELTIQQDSVCFALETGGQKWPGYYLGNGIYAVRYSSKKTETASYTITSTISALNGQTGKYVSVNPWPGKSTKDDYQLGKSWYGDRPNIDLFIGEQQGAKTISKYREAYLMDWAKRWSWLQ